MSEVKKRGEPKRARRTQQERREHTIARLVSATIEALLELGYARTTVKEICQRAELSHGALFRFFPTLPDLILAAAEEIGKRRLSDFELRFAKAKIHSDPDRAALTLLREACRAPTNMVFYELMVAARTDDELRRRLRQALQRYYEAIRESALEVPVVAKLAPELRDAVVFAVIHMFDGESLARSILPQPAAEETRLAMFASGLGLIAGGETEKEHKEPKRPARARAQRPNRRPL